MSLALSALAATVAKCMAGSDSPQSEAKSSKSTPGATQCKLSPVFIFFMSHFCTHFVRGNYLWNWMASRVFPEKTQGFELHIFHLTDLLWEFFQPQVEWLNG